MERDSFIFYRSFYEALFCLDASDRQVAMDAIMRYALDGEESEISGVALAIFKLVKPQLDANTQRYKSGMKSKGTDGEPEVNNKQTASKAEVNGKQSRSKSEANAKQTMTEPEANDKQTASKTGANENENVNVNENDNVNEKENVNENDNVRSGEKSAAHTADSGVYVSAKKQSKINAMLSEYANGDTEIESLLISWAEIRKDKRLGMTMDALRLNLDKLCDTAKASGMNASDYLREVIRRGWGTFYPIEGTRNIPQKKTDFSEHSFDLEEFEEFALGNKPRLSPGKDVSIEER